MGLFKKETKMSDNNMNKAPRHEEEKKEQIKAQQAGEPAKDASKEGEAAKEKKSEAKRIEELEMELGKAREEVEKVKKDIAKEKDDYLRLLAEFQTFRHRNEEDRKDLIASAAGDTIKGLLPVLDDCERALQLLEKSGDKAAKEGTKLIYDKLMAYLKTKGLEKMEVIGKKFDTDFHEAVAKVPAENEDGKGKVFDVIQTGYIFNGKVLRFAKVVVSQ